MHAYLPDFVRWTGVIVAIIGAFEAAPAGSARIWRGVRRQAARARAWLSEHLPWRKAEPVNTVARAGAAAALAKVGASARGHAWYPNAPAWEQTRILYELYVKLDNRMTAMQGENRKHIEAVRTEILQAVGELRSADAALAARLEDSEDQSARSDARGIAVVVVGVVLTGAPDGLARYAPLGWAAMAGAVIIAAAIGARVIRDERR